MLLITARSAGLIWEMWDYIRGIENRPSFDVGVCYSAAPVLALRWTVALQDLGDLVGIEEWGNRAGDVVLPAEPGWGKVCVEGSVCRDQKPRILYNRD